MEGITLSYKCKCGENYSVSVNVKNMLEYAQEAAKQEDLEAGEILGLDRESITIKLFLESPEGVSSEAVCNSCGNTIETPEGLLF